MPTLDPYAVSPKALEWSEAVTFVSWPQWFTDIEIVKLTMIIAVTTAWNRVETSFP
jgi:alkylhydroperoxidase family enzyme